MRVIVRLAGGAWTDDSSLWKGEVDPSLLGTGSWILMTENGLVVPYRVTMTGLSIDESGASALVYVERGKVRDV